MRALIATLLSTLSAFGQANYNFKWVDPFVEEINYGAGSEFIIYGADKDVRTALAGSCALAAVEFENFRFAKNLALTALAGAGKTFQDSRFEKNYPDIEIPDYFYHLEASIDIIRLISGEETEMTVDMGLSHSNLTNNEFNFVVNLCPLQNDKWKLDISFNANMLNGFNLASQRFRVAYFFN